MAYLSLYHFDWNTPVPLTLRQAIQSTTAWIKFRPAGKIVAPRDVTRKTNDPPPIDLNNHDTACANGAFGASGKACQTPIGLRLGLAERS